MIDPHAGADRLDQLDVLIDEAPIGFALLDAERRFVRLNPRLAEINGLPISAHLGRTPAELLPGIPPDAFAPLELALAGTPSTVETVGSTHAEPGVERHWLVSWIPVRGADGAVTGAAAFAHEITQGKRAEAALRASEALMRRVLDGLFILVGVLRPDGVLVEVNRAALDAIGAEACDVLGRHVRETPWIAGTDAVPYIDAAIARAAAGAASRFDLPIRLADGRRITVDFQLAPLVDDDGAVTHLLASGADVSDRLALLDAERAARDAAAGAVDRIARLQAVTAALAAARDPADVARAIVEDGRAALGAATGVVYALERDRLELLGAAGYPEQATAAWESIPLDLPVPICEAARRGRTVLAEDGAEVLARWPALAGATSGAGGTLVATPLVADGRVRGAIGFVAPTGALGRVERALVETLARLAGQALERARVHAEQSEIASALQESLLEGSLRAGPGLEVAARYRPAVRGQEAGGDWYHAFPLPDGTTALVVGDVVGHGIRAAAAMGKVRAATRALAGVLPGPAAVLAQLDVYVEHLPAACYSTLAMAALDASTGALRHASAGHPAPLLVAPDGTTRLLEAARSHPLAVPGPPRPEATDVVPPGGVLLLYTDGLVERRGEPLDVGLARLEAAAAAAGPADDLEAFADAVLARTLPPSGLGDDVCLLAVRRLP